jgi:hypothetical protein
MPHPGLQTLGCKENPIALALLTQHLGEVGVAALGELDRLLYLRDEAHWWFMVKPGEEENWLALLRRQFESFQILQEALAAPESFCLSLYLRLSGEQSGGATFMDLRTQPYVLIGAEDNAALVRRLQSLAKLREENPDAQWLKLSQRVLVE